MWVSLQVVPLIQKEHSKEEITSTFSGLLEILGQQSTDVGSLVNAPIQPWHRFLWASSRCRSSDVPVMFCQALLKLSSQGIPIV